MASRLLLVADVDVGNLGRGALLWLLGAGRRQVFGWRKMYLYFVIYWLKNVKLKPLRLII
jgi:hypothetical protein